MLTDGINVEYRLDGEIRGAQAWVLDFENPENNDWLAVNQFTVSESAVCCRRFDIILFVNGLPLAVIELKNAADENATIWTAFQQLQTYKSEIPSLFAFDEALVSEGYGVQARIGTLTANREWLHAMAERYNRIGTGRGPIVRTTGLSWKEYLRKAAF